VNQDLLRDLYSFLKDELGKRGHDIDKDGICLTSSILVREILIRLGYVCSVRRVEILIVNDEGRKILEEYDKTGIMLSKDEVIARGGWIIGLGWAKDDFHYLVCFLLEDSIMDLTFGIVDRPEHGIKASPMWVTLETLPGCVYSICLRSSDDDQMSTPLLDDKIWMKDVVTRGRKLLLKYRLDSND